MYEYKVTEKTDYDAIQKAHMEEGVRPGVFMPLDVQMRKARASKNEEPKVEKSEDDIEKGKGVLDEAKWERAKKIVAKQKKAPADKYAMISHIYQKMGGKYSSKKSEFDGDDLMKAAAPGFVRKEPDGKGGWIYYYRNPKTGKVEAGKKFSAKQRFGVHKEQHEKHRKEYYATAEKRKKGTAAESRSHDKKMKEASKEGEHHLEAARAAKKEMGKKKKSQFDANDLMKAAIG